MNTSTTTATVEAGKMPALPGKPVHIMLDLETLGTAPGSVILSIGACVFDENGPLDGCDNRFHLNIDVERTVDAGFLMDTSTALWWMKQGDAARGALLAGQKGAVGPHVAMVDFCEWLKRVAPDDKARFIWGKGPSFDCGLLAAAYRLMRLPTPWRYPNERCVRTVAAMRPDIAEPVREGVHHSALDDALHQARHVGAVMRALSALPCPSVSSVANPEAAEGSRAPGRDSAR